MLLLLFKRTTRHNAIVTGTAMPCQCDRGMRVSIKMFMCAHDTRTAPCVAWQAKWSKEYKDKQHTPSIFTIKISNLSPGTNDPETLRKTLEDFEDEWTSRTSGQEDFHDEPGAGIDDARALQKTSVCHGIRADAAVWFHGVLEPRVFGPARRGSVCARLTALCALLASQA